jgi:hypothetical protein
MTNKENEILDSALKQFGLEKQIIKCVEELSELQKELCKQLWGQGNLENIKEEIADVEIMIEQVKKGLDIGFYELEAVRVRKLNRLSKKLVKLQQKDELSKAEIERKCQQCSFTVMTDAEIQALGGEDPCDTCHNLSNWKPKEESIVG